MSHQLINASAHATGLPDKSVHCIVTSPPYFGLRSYAGEQDIEWQAMQYSPIAELPMITIPAMRCGLGAEPSPEMFIGHLILVMREMWRILRDDGTCWVNLGDSYNGSGGAGGDYGPGGIKEGQPKFPGRKISALKPKDLIMVPARFALAAQADGWYLRSDLPWLKRSAMPESVTDRPATTIEHVYLLAKSEKYFFDMEAIKMPVASESVGRAQRKQNLMDRTGQGTLGKQIENGVDNSHGYAGLAQGRNGKTGYDIEGGRSFRSSDLFFKTWQGMLTDDDNLLAVVANTQGFSGAHFATFPPALVEPMIRAGSSAYGVCAECGAPWRRVVEKASSIPQRTGEWKATGQEHRNDIDRKGGFYDSSAITTGWAPTCACDAGEAIPATVLDPFAGSGTSLRVAMSLGRNAIGVDICQSYLEDLAPKRMSNVQTELAF